MLNTTIESFEEAPVTAGNEALARLTQIERLVLTLIAEGHSQKAIAAKLHRSIDTVKSHRRTIGRKLGSTNRVELARLAIEHGVVSLPSERAESNDHPIQNAVAASTGVPVALVDHDGACASVSPGFARMIGGKPEELRGRTLQAMLMIESEFSLPVILSQVLAGSCVQMPAVARRDDDTLMSVVVHFLPLPSPARRAYLLISGATPLPRCVGLGNGGSERA